MPTAPHGGRKHPFAAPRLDGRPRDTKQARSNRDRHAGQLAAAVLQQSLSSLPHPPFVEPPGRKQRALVAVANSILVITWHLLSDPDAQFTDLGPDWHDRLAPIRRKRQLIAELKRLTGKTVTLQEAAA